MLPPSTLNIGKEGVETWKGVAELGGGGRRGVDNLLLIFKSLDGGKKKLLMKESEIERLSWSGVIVS